MRGLRREDYKVYDAIEHERGTGRGNQMEKDAERERERERWMIGCTKSFPGEKKKKEKSFRFRVCRVPIKFDRL